MKYVTMIHKGTAVIFQSEFESKSDEDALKVHTRNIEICERDITEDWDYTYLIVVDEHGNTIRLVL
jgi:hypothetical protein